MVPETYRRVDRFVEVVQKWYRVSLQHNDPREPQEADWDRYWGSRFWRGFVFNFLRAGWPIDQAGCGSVTTLWATHGNVVPGTAWLLMEILQRPGLKDDILAELNTALTSSSLPQFDMPKLLALPLLNAVWEETLRLRVAAAVYREAEEDMYISNTLIPKGSQILSPSVGHHNPDLWAPFSPSASDDLPQYAINDYPATPSPPRGPADFDPTRFLAARRIKADKNASKHERERAAAALAPYNFSPWGGGTHMCSGRYFAKQEALFGVAATLVGFDIDVLCWVNSDGSRSERPAGPVQAKYGFGIMAPDRDLQVRMTRKGCW
jgi:hypothetical protein